MSKGFTGLNPRNQAFKEFKCPILNVLIVHFIKIIYMVMNEWKEQCKEMEEQISAP